MAISVLAKSSVITPFIAGGLGITYGTVTQSSYITMLYVTILFYFVAYFANTWAESDNRSMTSMINIIQPTAGELSKAKHPSLILKIITLVIFTLLPIPKPPFYIQGILAITIAVTFYCMNSHREAGDVITCVIAQTFILITLGVLFNRFSNHASYSMALIAAVAIPNLLKPGSGPGGYSPYQNDANIGLISLAVSFFLTFITPGYSANSITKSVSFFLTFITPGYSANSITKSMFMPGVSQLVAGTILDSAIEGWALHIALNNQTTTKAVLGDLLSLPELEWSTFTPYNSVKLVMLCLPIIAALIVVSTPMLNVSVPIIVPCSILMLQATISCGLLWSALFILCGCINHSLSGSDKGHTSLAFMTQI
jgi:hypothetical protein